MKIKIHSSALLTFKIVKNLTIFRNASVWLRLPVALSTFAASAVSSSEHGRRIGRGPDRDWLYPAVPRNAVRGRFRYDPYRLLLLKG